METVTYPYLVAFRESASKYLQPATLDWVHSKAKSIAGGKAYPANSPLADDAVTEGVSDAGLYRRVYNACVAWAGKDLADKVARAAMPTERDTQSMDYRQEPEVDPMNDGDLEGLKEEMGELYDMVGAMFMWNYVNTHRLTELYGPGLKPPPDYVPKEKRQKWASLWAAVLKATGSEERAFAVANGKFGPKS